MSSTAAKPARETYVRRDELILAHLSLVNAIAYRVRESLPIHINMDDLVQSGVLGLFDAATKYTETKEVAFGVYARYRIRGAMLDSLRSLDMVSRDMRRHQRQSELAKEELSKTLQRVPTETELAEKMGVGIRRWRQIQVELRMLASASRAHSSDDERPSREPQGSKDLGPDSIVARRELRCRLENAMAELPARYREVIHLYYNEDMSMEEIGTRLGVQESRVSQIHKAALTKLQNTLRGTGILSAGAAV